jgi:hypothetical protein
MKQDRTLLEQNLIKPTLEIKKRKGIVKDIKKHLSENFSIFDGSVQTWINNPSEELNTIDTRLLYLFAEQIYAKTADENIKPDEFFTNSEIKASKQFSGKMFIKDDIKFPIEFQPAIQHSMNSWTTKIHIKVLVEMYKSRLLHWNPESQREATLRIVNGNMIEQATIYMENVNEMKNLLKRGELESTQLTFNASVGTADGDEEVTYNDATYKLIIHNCKLDTIDGMHRIKAAELALAEKPDIDFWFDLKILNLTVDRAAKYLAQISKGNRISETKRKSMSKESYEILIIDDLKNKSELGDRISKKEGLTSSRKELVTYNTLLSAIESNFNIGKKSVMYETSEYLIEFFDVLIGSYEEEFTTNYPESKKETMLVENNMFYGYILLASKMMANNIEARKVRKYINKIDFSKTNEEWKKKGILDDMGRLSKNPRKGIEEFFREIEI